MNVKCQNYNVAQKEWGEGKGPCPSNTKIRNARKLSKILMVPMIIFLYVCVVRIHLPPNLVNQWVPAQYNLAI